MFARTKLVLRTLFLNTLIPIFIIIFCKLSVCLVEVKISEVIYYANPSSVLVVFVIVQAVMSTDTLLYHTYKGVCVVQSAWNICCLVLYVKLDNKC